MREPGASTLTHLLVALGVLVIAALSAWQTTEVPGSVVNAVGPEVVPWFVTAFLFVVGLGLLVAALRGGWAQPEDGPITEWGALALVSLGLVANAALIEWIGFILASTLMFPLVARGFGSRRPLTDAAIGFALAFVAYVGFDRVLGYRIGSGLIESLF
jgi:putative tricarboxylic transport membrane protein